MKKHYAITFASLVTLTSTAALADQAEGPWLMRIRAVNVEPANKSTDPTGTLGSDTIHVSTKTIPEVDFTYFFSKNLAAELILTYPQQHDVTVSGTNIGTFKELPPTLTLQYHFLPDGQFRPYVGAGVNYTRISNVSLAGGALDLDSSSVGGALQAGMDIKVGQNSYINLDVKKVYIKSDVKVAGAGTLVSTVNVDPLLVGIGYGFKF